MNEVETLKKLVSALRLPLPEEGSLHPYAEQRYVEFLAELLKKVTSTYPVGEEDLQQFLSPGEYARLEACEDEIKGWLKKCGKDNDQVTLSVYPYHSPFYTMWDLRMLIKKVTEGKAQEEKKKQQEALEREEQEALLKRRQAVLAQVNPPIEDARTYLSAEEYEQFRRSLPGAIDAYLQTDATQRKLVPDIWLWNESAWDYARWISKIRERKDEALRLQQAETEYAQYARQGNETVAQFKKELAAEKKPKFVYPPAVAKYEPHRWCGLELPTKQQVEKWASQQIWERVPVILKEFITWELEWQVQALPYTKYEVLGVPCLTWCFRLLVLVEVYLRLPEKEFTKEFHGYSYGMKNEGKDLGHLYLGPVEWDDQEGFTTPLALLSLLAKGKWEGPGIEVIDRTVPFTRLSVTGFEGGHVEIHDLFRKFMVDSSQGKSTAAALVDAGVTDADMSRLVQEKEKLPLPPMTGAGANPQKSTCGDDEVISALEGLGYKKAEIRTMVDAAKFSPGMSLEEKVKAALKNVST